MDHRSAIDPVLCAKDLYRFSRMGNREQLVLRGVSVTLRPGTITAVHGPPGEARDALLGCLSGLLDPDGGTVRLCGSRISHRAASHRDAARRAHLAIVHRSGNLIAHLTLAENIALTQRASRKDGLWPVSDVLAGAGLSSRASTQPGELSADEAAQAAVAVALAVHPTVLLAEEPTEPPAGSLTPAGRRQVLDQLAGATDRGTALLIATESPHVLSIADAVHQIG